MRHILIFLPLLTLCSCANVPSVQNEAQRASSGTACSSLVEATLISDTLYTSKPPLLILKKAYTTARVLRGAIHQISDSGVVFLRAKDGLYTPDPKFYSVDEIECLIDSNNRVRFGKWKGSSIAFWNIELLCQRSGAPDSKPVTMVLEPNRKVSYCVDAGEYKVIRIRFRGFDDFVNQSDSLCCTRFTVKQNAITTLGKVELKYTWTPPSDFAIIPITVIHRPGMNETTPFLGGAIGGAVGGVLQHLADREQAENERMASPFHALRIKIDSAYTPVSKSGLPLHFSPLNYDEFTSAP
jgi:hypothetical protein